MSGRSVIRRPCLRLAETTVLPPLASLPGNGNLATKGLETRFPRPQTRLPVLEADDVIGSYQGVDDAMHIPHATYPH